ncbi:MAG: recombination regulator RecX [Gammaproteobacteria bacterium]|jgi:regulatory protein|uniref:Regulatory protein RecX n=1 Tax=candidate division WWE3 bacterium TaxID=2053526 RepID=A0A928TWT4_UNCKA|nr:recombination regulator RecX [candidate division WWE3 bacterium]QOJ20853.1 MAG: recombination regulator RecX [Gammaproteobacteria bacterium]
MDTRSPLEIRALRYLAQREYSRRELEQKLSARKDSGVTAELAELTEVLDRLEQQGFLSEQRMVEQVARTRRSRFGSQRIIHELKAKGIDDHLIDGIRPALKENELEAALNIWRKKFDHPPATREERAKQIRFMMNRGFSMETIQRVLSQANEENA